MGGQEGVTQIWTIGDLLKQRPRRALNLTRGQLEGQWAALVSEDAPKAFEGILMLRAHPKLTIPFWQERLRPVPPPDSKRIAQLLEELDNDRFIVREAATIKLEKLGRVALPALNQMLQGEPSLEARRRGESIRERIEQQLPTGETLRTIRAIEVLEYIATPEAYQLLEKLANGALATAETEAAKDALGRLTMRSPRSPTPK